MSIRVTRGVIAELRGRTAAEQLMLLMLADFADDFGYSYPAIGTLATRCRIGSRHASDILQELKSRGLIDIEANRGPRGANQYRVILDEQEAPTNHSAWVTNPSSGVAPPNPSASPMHCGSETLEPQFMPPPNPSAYNPPLNRQEPFNTEEQDTNTAGATSTAATRVCISLKRLEISGLNPGHPKFLALIAAGATEAEFVGAAQAAIEKGKGFAYSLGMLKNMRIESANGASAMPKGPMPIGGHRQSAVDRRIETINGLTGRSRSHDSEKPIDIIDAPARLVD